MFCPQNAQNHQLNSRMAGDINDHELLWRWLSHSEETIFLQDGLYNLKDLLMPSIEELPLFEANSMVDKSKQSDIQLLEKQLKGKVQN